jgi:signal transduction histidine kinase
MINGAARPPVDGSRASYRGWTSATVPVRNDAVMSSAASRTRDLLVVVGGCLLDLVGFSQVLAGSEESPAWVAGYAAAGFVAVMWLHAVIAAVAIPSYGPVVGLMIALFTVANRCSRVVGLGALALSLVPAVILTAGEVAGSPPELVISVLAASLTLLSLVNAGAWSLGRWARAHHERLELIERQRRREAQEALTAERTRIARDLHDSAGHALNVILVHAGLGRLSATDDAARSSFTTIEDVARQTVGDIDQLVGALRGGEEAGVEPPPGLAALDTLLERHRQAGLDVTTSIEGEPRALRPGVDRGAYRILQEALTNSARHGRGAARVGIAFRAATLEVSVDNPVDPERARRDGYGLIGMRERAASLGGTLETTDRDGRFRLRARLPA